MANQKSIAFPVPQKLRTALNCVCPCCNDRERSVSWCINIDSFSNQFVKGIHLRWTPAQVFYVNQPENNLFSMSIICFLFHNTHTAQKYLNQQWATLLTSHVLLIRSIELPDCGRVPPNYPLWAIFLIPLMIFWRHICTGSQLREPTNHRNGHV